MRIELKPEQIPQYTGDLPELEKDHAALTKDAGRIRTTGADVHSHFQGLSAFYQAPEAEQLFATTKPVKTRAAEFADGLETVAAALSGYADEIRPLVPKLARLKREAQAFIRDHGDDEDGDYDEDLIAEHNRIRDDITATVAAFWAAERTCHNRIVALWNGPKMVAGDGSQKANQYGFTAEDMKNAKLPWGDPVEEQHHWYEVGHWVKSFVWDGLVVDGIWGTIKGLGTLVGFGGWEAMGQAWKGLAQLATGLAISAVPGAGTAFWALPEDKLPSWLRDSRTAMKETGKALVAWDEWGKNPGRAAGAVTFNVLTTVFTGGAGGAAAGAGKAGAVAKALSVAGKAGKAIDPMAYVAKGAGAGLSKIGDIAKGLQGIGKIDVPTLPADAVKLPEGSLKLPDGTVHLPEGAALPPGAAKLPDGNVRLPDDVPALPEDATKLPTGPGEPARYFDGQGNLLDEHGNVLDSIDNARKEGSPDLRPATGADLPKVGADTPAKVPAMAGAGVHAADNAGHLRLGGSFDTPLGDTARLGDDATTPAGHADDLGRTPSASHEPPTSGGHTGGHGDGPSGGGHEGPTGGHGEGPGGGHEAPGGGRGDGPGGDGPGGGPGGGDGPGGNGADGPDGWERQPEDSGPLARGGETEQKFLENLRGTSVKQGDVERILQNLADHPAGREVADAVASGRFKDSPGFSKLVSNLSGPNEISGCLEQIRLADRLRESGVTDISFEIGSGTEIKPGVVTGEGTDLDVMARDADGNAHGYQFKRVANPKKLVQKVFGNMDQLEFSGADLKTFVVDTKGTLADHVGLRTQQRLTDVYGEKGVQFVIRVEDGVLVIPPDGKFMPEGTL